MQYATVFKEAFDMHGSRARESRTFLYPRRCNLFPLEHVVLLSLVRALSKIELMTLNSLCFNH